MSSTIPSSGSTGTGKSGNPANYAVGGAPSAVQMSPDQMGNFNQGIAQGQPPMPGLSTAQIDPGFGMGGSTGTGKSMNMGGPYTPYMPQPDVMPQDMYNNYQQGVYGAPQTGYSLGPDQQQQMQTQDQFFSGTLNPQQGLNQVLQQYQPPAPAPIATPPAAQPLVNAIAAPTQARPQPVVQPRPAPRPQPMLNRPQVVARPAPRPQPVQQVRQPAYSVSQVNPALGRGIRR